MTAYPTAFGSRDQFSLADGSAATIFRISQIDKLGLADTTKLPFSIRVLLEAALRNHDGFLVRDIGRVGRLRIKEAAVGRLRVRRATVDGRPIARPLGRAVRGHIRTRRRREPL